MNWIHLFNWLPHAPPGERESPGGHNVGGPFLRHPRTARRPPVPLSHGRLFPEVVMSTDPVRKSRRRPPLPPTRRLWPKAGDIPPAGAAGGAATAGRRHPFSPPPWCQRRRQDRTRTATTGPRSMPPATEASCASWKPGSSLGIRLNHCLQHEHVQNRAQTSKQCVGVTAPCLEDAPAGHSVTRAWS
jgi:hypothetical protein